MQLSKLISKNYSKILLGIIFVIALALRWWYLPNRNISFGYDQSRDAFAAQQIIQGHLKILGPPTSGTPGLFHGVLYYYVIAPAYLAGHGDPLTVVYWMSFINALGVFAVFYLTYLLTKKNIPSLIAAFIFAFSFDAIQFSNFISNVSLGILFVPVIYIGLFLWIKKLSKFAPVLTGLALGLAVQSEVAFGFYLIPILFWLLFYRNRVIRKELFVFVMSFVFAISTMIIAEAKFSFPGIKGLYYLFTSQDAIAQSKKFSDFLATFINQIGDRLANTIYPFNTVFGSLLGFGMIIYSFVKKAADKSKNIPTWQSFLITLVAAHIIALPFGGSLTPYLAIGAISGIAAFVGIFLWQTFEKNNLLLIIAVFLLLLVNLTKTLNQGKNPHDNLGTTFPYLSTELKVIDYTYQKAEGKPFSISTLTAPIYINTLWSYLYNWYGMQRYGYLPYWAGHDQIGQPGDNLIPPPAGVKEHFFIVEPTNGISPLLVTYAKGDQDSISNLVDVQTFGEIVVQERIMKNE